MLNFLFGDEDQLAQIGNAQGFDSIEEAVVHARSMKGQADTLLVRLLEGEYRLDRPLRIEAGSGPLKIVGAGSDKTVIKGSKELQLVWQPYEGAIKVAQLEKDFNFDQLFINGEQQILARYPNYDEQGGHWQGHAPDAIAKERVQTWKNPKGAIVHAMHRGEWGGFHYEVTGIDNAGELVLKGGHQNNRPSPMHEKYRMVENVFEELDSPGEWYFDNATSQLYYWPQEGIDLKEDVIEVVSQKHLIEIVGSEENPVADITMKEFVLNIRVEP